MRILNQFELIMSLSLGLMALGAVPGVAEAQEEELHLMREPIQFTDVADAFDDEDPFDLNLRIEYAREVQRALITRESEGSFVDIADYSREVQRLNLGVEIGVFQDLALYARMPLVLSDDRELSLPSGRSREEVGGDLCHVDPAASPAQDCSMPATLTDESVLFNVPSTSATRSGIEYVAFGVAVALMNQQREPHLATWVLRLEGRVGVGDAMSPCIETVSGRVCGAGATRSGVNPQTAGFRVESRASRRFRYAEPYGGISFQIDWPAENAAFTPTGDLAGFTNTLPPREGEITAGLVVIPWENQAKWQRFALDFQFSARYISEGHTRGPLYDVLGTSTSPFLTSSNLEGVPDETNSRILREVPFVGLTDVQPHARVGGRFSLDILAARYVRFQFGAAFYYHTKHLITHADACNPSASPTDSSDPRAGTCVSGIINPHHRPVLDLPGRRFRVEDAYTYEIGASVQAQF